ncbi:diglucosyl diacylglycerol synthase [Aeribacillus pallidus]|uniref:diglucosyl diacylglycerol synthase n=1 Tax=Aeribacillus TaxID=1055323 RepID=UPI0007B4A3FE|nr:MULTISPECIES: diglucosyl diacylglycerol synthase [Aeribacillus]KZM55065.1 diglucosyl diacylglycerol synthase [Aeribacillus pallidus]MED0651632.1 diglucosyl diacylglycerol synthase [Aeribacillus composti]MED4485240.1 diglucosyl diacylglycerol synthase [Aeribacillus pallidus]
MLKDPKILILTANYGNGHIQVAKTLEQSLHKMGINNVKVSDLISESHPIMAEITRYLYLKSFSIGKQFYRLFYYSVDKMSNKRIMNLYLKLGHRKLNQLVREINPDIIINTFPISVVPEYRTRTGVFIPTFNVLTDFCLHRVWVHKNIDKYYVSCDDVKEKLTMLNIHPALVKVTGIPIRPQFEEKMETIDLYKKYNLDPNKKTLLIATGAHGVLKNVKDLCESFFTRDDMQIVVVCGNNQSLKDELEPLQYIHPDRIKVFGYVERIDELFRICSCMITKPGGITLSEAAALKVPLILYKPVPGQERENADLFAAKGAAVVINKLEKVQETVNDLFNHPEKMKKMKMSIAELYRPNAADTILQDILNEAEMLLDSSLKGSVNY